MVKKIFNNILNKEFSGLHQAAFLLGSFAFASQILALVRDRIFASTFGASVTLDVYYAAFRIPDILYASIASLVSVTVLIPFLINRLNSGGRENAYEFINNIFTAFLILIAVVSIFMFAVMPWLSDLLFPGFSEESVDTLVSLTRILLLSPIILGISNLFGSIVQTYKKFFVYALSPILYNIGIIFGVLFLYPIFGISGLGYGVVIGALLHLCVQIPVVLKHGLFPKFSFNIDFSVIKKVAVVSLPRTIGLSANRIALLLLISFASVMEEGSIAIFNFSLNLQSVPLSIIGVSYSVAAFPTLVRLFSDKKMEKFMDNMVIAIRHILFWSIPALALFVVLRAQIVRTILGSGEFSWNDTMLTAASLALFSVSLVAQTLMLLFIRGYYAGGNTKKPLIVNVISSISILGIAYLLVDFFETSQFFRYFIESLLRVDGISGTSVLMLPLAYSIGTIINVILLMYLFKKDFGKFPPSVELTFRHSFYSAVIVGFTSWQFLQVFDDVFDINTFWGILSQGFFSGIIGITIGIILLKIIGNKEVMEIYRALHSKFWRSNPIEPEKDEL